MDFFRTIIVPAYFLILYQTLRIEKLFEQIGKTDVFKMFYCFIIYSYIFRDLA